MTTGRASIYSRDPDRFVLNAPEKAPKKIKYIGPERRMQDRREQRDRRVDIRFDLSKPDRRQVEGRRESDIKPKFW